MFGIYGEELGAYDHCLEIEVLDLDFRAIMLKGLRLRVYGSGFRV